MALSEPSIKKGNDIPETEKIGDVENNNVQSIAEVEGGAKTPSSQSELNDAAISQSIGMRVRKRNGDLEQVDVNKIVDAVARCAEGLKGVDPMRVATRTISASC